MGKLLWMKKELVEVELDDLYEKFHKLVRQICNKYHSMATAAITEEDILSEGFVGLLKAYNSYDESKGIQFSSYLGVIVSNQCSMLFRNIKKHQKVTSLQAPLGEDKDGNLLGYEDVLEDESSNFENSIEAKIVVSEYKGVLTDREYYILTESVTKYRSQQSLSEELGISRSYVSRIYAKACKKMKGAIEGKMPRKRTSLSVSDVNKFKTWVQEGRTLAELSEEFKLNPATISKLKQRYGVESLYSKYREEFIRMAKTKTYTKENLAEYFNVSTKAIDRWADKLHLDKYLNGKKTETPIKKDTPNKPKPETPTNNPTKLPPIKEPIETKEVPILEIPSAFVKQPTDTIIKKEDIVDKDLSTAELDIIEDKEIEESNLNMEVDTFLDYTTIKGFSVKNIHLQSDVTTNEYIISVENKSIEVKILEDQENITNLQSLEQFVAAKQRELDKVKEELAQLYKIFIE